MEKQVALWHRARRGRKSTERKQRTEATRPEPDATVDETRGVSGVSDEEGSGGDEGVDEILMEDA